MGLRKKSNLLGAYDKLRGLFAGRFTKFNPDAPIPMFGMPAVAMIDWNRKPVHVELPPMNVSVCQVCGRPGSTLCPYCPVVPPTFPPCAKCGYKFKPGETGHTCLPPYHSVTPKPVGTEAEMDAWHEMWCEKCQEEKNSMSDTTRPQKDPREGKTSVTDLVLKDIEERRKQGIAKYGTELKTDNGRKAMVDLYQELLDAVMYVRQVIEERKERNEIMSAQMKEGGTLEQLELPFVGEHLYARPGRFVSVSGAVSETVKPGPWITVQPVPGPSGLTHHVNITEETILEEAQRLVHGDRGKDYGHPIFDMTRSADMLTSLLRDKLRVGVRLEAEDIAQAMICVKQSRERNQPKRDNNTDTAGYAEVKQMIKEWRDAHPGQDPRDCF